MEGLGPHLVYVSLSLDLSLTAPSLTSVHLSLSTALSQYLSLSISISYQYLRAFELVQGTHILSYLSLILPLHLTKEH